MRNPNVPDDCRFLAAAQAALVFVERFGELPGKQKAESVGILTFYLLDWLHAQQAAEG